MDERIPVAESVSRAWAEVANGARMTNHMLTSMPSLTAASNFAQIDAVYAYEKASDWHRAYLAAALEHLVVWADFAAPLRFHPEHEVTFTFRPAHTLGRAAMEAASQAVWMTAGGTAQECARRRLALIRWDYAEHRKSQADLTFKERIAQLDARLLDRASDVFDESDLRPPSHLTVLRAAAPVVGLDPDEVEEVWRAASGAAHGRNWASIALQHVVPLEEYEPGHLKTLRVPDPGPMTDVLRIAEKMTTYGVLRHADFRQADIGRMIEQSRLWLSSVIPFRDDADAATVALLKRPVEPTSAGPNPTAR